MTTYGYVSRDKTLTEEMESQFLAILMKLRPWLLKNVRLLAPF